MRIKKVNGTAVLRGNVIDNVFGNSIENAASQKSVNDMFVYSTEEKRIGTWYDKKPLYRKVFIVTSSDIKEVDISSLNVDHIMYDKSTIDFFVDNLHFTRHEYNNGGNESFILFRRNNTMQIRINNIVMSVFNKIELVLEYTKTTDQKEG